MVKRWVTIITTALLGGLLFVGAVSAQDGEPPTFGPLSVELESFGTNVARAQVFENGKLDIALRGVNSTTVTVTASAEISIVSQLSGTIVISNSRLLSIPPQSTYDKLIVWNGYYNLPHAGEVLTLYHRLCVGTTCSPWSERIVADLRTGQRGSQIGIDIESAICDGRIRPRDDPMITATVGNIVVYTTTLQPMQWSEWIHFEQYSSTTPLVVTFEASWPGRPTAIDRIALAKCVRPEPPVRTAQFNAQCENRNGNLEAAWSLSVTSSVTETWQASITTPWMGTQMTGTTSPSTTVSRNGAFPYRGPETLISYDIIVGSETFSGTKMVTCPSPVRSASVVTSCKSITNGSMISGTGWFTSSIAEAYGLVASVDSQILISETGTTVPNEALVRSASYFLPAGQLSATAYVSLTLDGFVHSKQLGLSACWLPVAADVETVSMCGPDGCGKAGVINRGHFTVTISNLVVDGVPVPGFTTTIGHNIEPTWFYTMPEVAYIEHVIEFDMTVGSETSPERVVIGPCRYRVFLMYIAKAPAPAHPEFLAWAPPITLIINQPKDPFAYFEGFNTAREIDALSVSAGTLNVETHPGWGDFVRDLKMEFRGKAITVRVKGLTNAMFEVAGATLAYHREGDRFWIDTPELKPEESFLGTLIFDVPGHSDIGTYRYDFPSRWTAGQYSFDRTATLVVTVKYR